MTPKRRIELAQAVYKILTVRAANCAGIDPEKYGSFEAQPLACRAALEAAVECVVDACCSYGGIDGQEPADPDKWISHAAASCSDDQSVSPVLRIGGATVAPESFG